MNTPRVNPFAHLTTDIPAGIVVFLVALPLCLGIALASGAPLFAGIVAGAVAGLVVSWLSGSEISVSGPAAGLTVIVASGIAACGSYSVFLCAVVLAGLFQLLFATVRAGSLASFIPNSVINGMLAAIGVIIILKQIPHGLGRDADFEGDMNFWQFTDQENTFTEIIKAIMSFSPGVLIVTLVSLTLLLVWPKIVERFGALKTYLPAPLLAVGASIGLNAMFKAWWPELAISAEGGHLVQLPIAADFQSFLLLFTLPTFDVSKLSVIASTAFVLAVVGSVETLLCLEAADKIDPLRRTSRGNRELTAQGVGNIVSGFLGGLPMTSVVVRTSANVYAGAKGRLSGFVHGICLVIAVTALPKVLNLIPLGSLAAILILVGYKLSSVSIIRKMYAKGSDQFLPFLITMVGIVFLDMLSGVFAGLVTSMFFVVKSNYHSAITMVQHDTNYLIRFTKDVSFANKATLKSCLAKLPNHVTVTIDGSNAIFIDKDIFDVIEDFKESAEHRGIHVTTRNLASKRLKLFGQPSTLQEA